MMSSDIPTTNGFLAYCRNSFSSTRPSSVRPVHPSQRAGQERVLSPGRPLISGMLSVLFRAIATGKNKRPRHQNVPSVQQPPLSPCPIPHPRQYASSPDGESPVDLLLTDRRVFIFQGFIHLHLPNNIYLRAVNT